LAAVRGQSKTEGVEALLSLRPAMRPMQSLPLRLRRALPRPLRSLEDFERFEHSDLAYMDRGARRAESFRLRVLLAQIDPEQVPQWVLERLSRLEGAA
jgi:hypothetical protein